MYRPYRTFLLFLLFFGTLLLLAWIFPPEGIRISESFTLRFRKPSGIFAKETANDQKLKQLLANTREISDSAETASVRHDTVPALSALDSLILRYRDTLQTNICYFEYPSGDSTVLYPFFKKLQPEQREKSLHILHYGDSQIEVDRISSYLRKRFQKEYGGGGIGLFSLNSVEDFSRYVTGKASVNCERFGTNGKPVGKTGILSSLARFTSLADSADSLKNEGSYLNLTFTGNLHAPEQNVDFLRILYGPARKVCKLEIEIDKEKKSLEMSSASAVNSLLIPVGQPVRNIRLRFLSQDIPDMYALSLEDSLGILVDNIPLRGAAMANFRGMDPDLFRETDSLLNIGLVILEFGVNVASNVVKSYAYYRDIIVNHIADLKRTNPGVSCIIMGISDVAGKNGNGIETMKNVELIRDAQREAARITNCAFWDTFKAMGGRNSMPAWVANAPPLAQKDFIHFTPKGADLVGEMLYNAMMLEYFSYLKKNGNEKIDN
ncbi:MAG: hypothetical protein U0T82_00045 [Bacteroidales bacterium]